MTRVPPIDYPTAWELVNTPLEHHPRCSFEQTNGALLCDCDALYREWELLGKPQSKEEVQVAREGA
jgi:hypothetical protein